VCVCIHVCVCVCVFRMSAPSNVLSCVCVCVCVCIYVCVCVYLTYIHAHVCMYVRLYVHNSTCIHENLVCIYVFIHMPSCTKAVLFRLSIYGMCAYMNT
jgi:hypothetical protein